MITSLNILFYIRREKSDRTGLAPLYCRVTVNGERATFALHRSIHPNHWDSNKCKARGPSEESNNINNYIQSIRNRIYDAQLKLQNSGGITAKSIKLLILRKTTKKSRSFFTLFAEHNHRVKALIGSDFA